MVDRLEATLARLLVLAAGLAIAGALLGGPMAAGAGAAGLEVSVGDRLGDTTTLLAGQPVSLVASIFLLHSDPGCGTGDLTSLNASVSLPSEVALEMGASASQALTPPAAGSDPARAPEVVNARWPVRISAPGRFRGHVDVSGQSRTGQMCTGSQDFNVVAVARGPRLRVAGGVVFPDHIVAVVQARIPGSPPIGSAAYGDALEQNHDPGGETQGKGVLNLLSASYRGRNLTVNSASGFGAHGGSAVSCIDLARPRGFKGGSLPYRLHFNWNQEKGFRPVLAHGRMKVTPGAVNRAERQCLGQEQLSSGQRPIGR